MLPSEAAARRAASFERLAGAHVDLLVVGAGIVGSRVAYEAARNGLRVALVDAGDFGGETSASSSKLLHGGLRYLASGDLGLVRALQAERAALAGRIAPHLVRPLPLLLVVERRSRARIPKLAAGLALYALVSGSARPFPRLLRPAVAAELAPLDARAIRACGFVCEAATHDARLTLATVRAAVVAGALALNYLRVAELLPARGRIAAAVLDDVRTGERVTVRCSAVVSAAGPWHDAVRRLEDPNARPLTRLSKGVHAFLPLDGRWRGGVAVFDASRTAFAIPWQDMLMLGATDTEFDGDPSHARPEAADVESLLASFSELLPRDQLRADRVVHAVAGLRVLPRGECETARASRRPAITVGPGGMISIAGGKLTMHRRIAIDALRRLGGSLAAHRLLPSDDALPSARGLDAAAHRLRRRLDPATADHLMHLYGAESLRLLAYAESAPNALEPIDAAGPDVWAQAFFAVDEEWALKVEDVVSRRTTLAVRGLASEAVRRSLEPVVTGRALCVPAETAAVTSRRR